MVNKLKPKFVNIRINVIAYYRNLPLPLTWNEIADKLGISLTALVAFRRRYMSETIRRQRRKQ